MVNLIDEYIRTPGYIEMTLILIGCLFGFIAIYLSGLFEYGAIVAAGGFGAAIAFNLTGRKKFSK